MKKCVGSGKGSKMRSFNDIRTSLEEKQARTQILACCFLAFYPLREPELRRKSQ
ncbi:hypothetical protein KTT_52460 [Tengunoibacter tsumagoiensis]|uniref:Uncharacterized protein n=1 Tax=Tengunoibacter tsumagoiensis TaxID=2014871 RepID=A0A402A8A0_9CHLR|nr:hypothetical protein KTT_52460 [Tengunoibacter tsumagoiensis]